MASLGPLGASWGPLGAEGLVFQFLVPLLGLSWARLGGPFGLSWAALGPCWVPLGPSWGRLGQSWGRLGGSWGRLREVLGASWTLLERREAESVKTSKTFKNLWKSHDFCFLGLSWEASWRHPEASWRHLGPSGGNIWRLGIIFRRLGALLGCLGGLFGRFWPVFGLSWARLGPAEQLPGAAGNSRELPRVPGSSRKLLGNWGSGPLRALQPHYFSWLQGCMSLGALHYVLKARWWICDLL